MTFKSHSNVSGAVLIKLYHIMTLISSVVVLEESLVFENSRGPTYKSLSLSLDHKSSEIVKDFTFCKQSAMYDHDKSINLVTATMHEDMVNVKNILLTDVRYYLLIHVNK